MNRVLSLLLMATVVGAIVATFTAYIMPFGATVWMRQRYVNTTCEIVPTRHYLGDLACAEDNITYCPSACIFSAYPLCESLVSRNRSGSCCSFRTYCCYPYNGKCSRVVDNPLTYVSCTSIPRIEPEVDVYCPETTSEPYCCKADSYERPFPKGKKFGDKLPCWVDTTSTYKCEEILYEPPTTTQTEWIVFGVVLGLCLLAGHFTVFQISHFFLWPGVWRKTLTFYLLVWWIVLMPWGFVVFPVVVFDSHIFSGMPFIIGASLVMGIAIFFVIMINERRRRHRRWTLVAASFLASSVAAFIPSFFRYGMRTQGYIIYGICGAGFLFGFGAGIYSTHIRALFDAPITTASKTIKAVSSTVKSVLHAAIVSSAELLEHVPVAETPYRSGLLQFVNNRALSDLKFYVKGKRFYVHRIILLVRARELLEYLTAQRPNPDGRMSIDAVDPQVFLHLLELIYTGETQEKEGSGLKLNQIIEDLLAFQHLVPLDLIAQLDKHRTTIGKDKVAASALAPPAPGLPPQSVNLDEFVVLSRENAIRFPLEEVQRDFARAFLNPRYSDATLVSSDRVEFADCHRVLLAAHSSYFFSLFSGRWRPAVGSRFSLGVASHLLRPVLRYLYSEALSPEVGDGDQMVDLLVESQYFAVAGLQRHCERYLAARITKANVEAISHLAAHLECKALQAACQHYADRKGVMLLPPEEEMEQEERLVGHLVDLGEEASLGQSETVEAVQV